MPYLKQPIPQPEPIDCRILSAALELFVRDGYHNVSIHHIQKQANVSIGSIYNHFGGKEGVARALYIHILKEMEALVDDAIALETSPLMQCHAIIRDLFMYTESHRTIIAFVFQARHVEFLPDEPHACDSAPFIKMHDIVKKGMACGELRTMDTWVAASAVFGGAMRMIQLRLEGKIEEPLPSHFEQLITTVTAGVKATY